MKEFYFGYLGCQLDWEHQFEENTPFYMQVSLKGNKLHLSEHHGDASPGSAVRIKIEDLREFHASLQEKNYAYMNPGIEKTPWNAEEVTVMDPFYNKIIFYT